MRKTLTALTVASALLLMPSLSRAEDMAKQMDEVEVQPAAHPLDILPYDIVMGKADAPLTVVEYASLTCSHCARFHAETFEEVKKNYIDTGKVRFVFRHMPWDAMAMAASKLAVCSKASAPSFVAAFLKTTEAWARSSDPLAELKKVAKLGGMDEATADKCLQDAEVHQQITDMKQTGLEVLGVRSTPTLYVGRNVVVEGFRNYESFSQVLDAALESEEAAQE